jgi:flavin reductase (DIM6/NTAB) family NADH-FMN oxidoreductase RutF
MPDTAAPPSPAELRACMSRFTTGVAVVTYATAGGPRGATINSFTSVSAEPPLVLVSVARTARCHDQLPGRPFCVNILGAEQEPLAMIFAGMPVPAGQAGPRWAPGARTPRLLSPLAWVECEPWRCYDGGDHTLVLGQVTGLDHRDGDALSYAWSRFGQVSQGVLGIEFLF